MTYAIVKALHIIFVVTWFAGLFYIVRLFIYAAEANQEEDATKKQILLDQYQIMKRRLWYGITWPSAVITLGLGLYLIHLYGVFPAWLIFKLVLLIFLYAYHYSCHLIYQQQMDNNYKYSPLQLRLWNEVATLFLFAIVFTVILKGQISTLTLICWLIVFALLMYAAVIFYKKRREK